MFGYTRLLLVSTAKRQARLSPAPMTKRMFEQHAFHGLYRSRPRLYQMTQLTLGGIRQHGSHGPHHHHDADLVTSLKTSGMKNRTKIRENTRNLCSIHSLIVFYFDRQERHAYYYHRFGFQRWVDHNKRCCWMVII